MCTSNNDCTLDKSCKNGKCIDPCSLRAACGINAICKVIHHFPSCECPECYTGRPHHACKLDNQCRNPIQPSGRECSTNLDCPSTLYCEKGKCQSPCGHTSVCGVNEKCVAANHQASCQCKSKLVINALGELTCPDKAIGGCRADAECSVEQACISSVCQSPCTLSSCPSGKRCQVVNHQPICMCDKECEPEASICLKDKGCPPNKACVNFQCKDPCDGFSCPNGTPCVIQDHKAVCKFCPPGFEVDPSYGCIKGIEPKERTNTPELDYNRDQTPLCIPSSHQVLTTTHVFVPY